MQCPHCFRAHAAAADFDACASSIDDLQAACKTPKVTRVGDAYWVLGFETPIGPYDTKKAASEDLSGVNRFYLQHAKGL